MRKILIVFLSFFEWWIYFLHHSLYEIIMISISKITEMILKFVKKFYHSFCSLLINVLFSVFEDQNRRKNFRFRLVFLEFNYKVRIKNICWFWPISIVTKMMSRWRDWLRVKVGVLPIAILFYWCELRHLSDIQILKTATLIIDFRMFKLHS